MTSTDLPILLVDGNNVLVRAVEATRDRAMTGEGGVSTAGLVSFAKTLSRHTRLANPGRVVVCWDGGYARRSKILPTYKANRDHSGNEYRLQSRQLVDTFLTLSRIPQVRVEGEEADDLIASYWYSADQPVRILSSDKDLLQLVGATPKGHPSIQLRLTNKGDELWDLDQVESYFGVTAGKLTVAMAIAGDTSDNVDGVRGFGIKTAVKQLDKVNWDFGHRDLHAALREHRDLINRNLDLIDLRVPAVLHPPVVPPFMPIQPGENGWKEFHAFCVAHSLRQLVSRTADHSLWTA